MAQCTCCAVSLPVPPIVERINRLRALSGEGPLDPQVITTALRAALDDAGAFVMRMPTDKFGLLFLQDGRPVQPDPARLEAYQTHAGQRRGQWPASAEITAAMFERYTKPPGQ